MSNEEAIAQLTFLHHIETDRKAYRLVASIEMAISALESIDRIKTKLNARDKLVDKLEDRVYKLMAEKDAAVKILKKEVKDNFNLCYYCKHHSFDFCNDCDYEGSRWEWRGVEE